MWVRFNMLSGSLKYEERLKPVMWQRRGEELSKPGSVSTSSRCQLRSPDFIPSWFDHSTYMCIISVILSSVWFYHSICIISVTCVRVRPNWLRFFPHFWKNLWKPEPRWPGKSIITWCAETEHLERCWILDDNETGFHGTFSRKRRVFPSLPYPCFDCTTQNTVKSASEL